MALCCEGMSLPEICDVCDLSQDQVFSIISSSTGLSLKEVTVVYRLLAKGWDIRQISDKFMIAVSTLERFIQHKPDKRRMVSSRVLVVCVQSASGSKLIIQVNSSDMVHHLKLQIQEYEDIPVHLQSLTFGGRELSNDLQLSHYKIQHKSQLDLSREVHFC
jgi:hypothetical protein